MMTNTDGETNFQSLPQELRDVVYGYYLEDKILPARVFCLRMIDTSNQRTQQMRGSRPQEPPSGSTRSKTRWQWKVEKPRWYWRAEVPDIDYRRGDVQCHDHALASAHISIAREYLKVVQSRCPVQLEVDDEFLQPTNSLWDAWVEFSSRGQSSQNVHSSYLT